MRLQYLEPVVYSSIFLMPERQEVAELRLWVAHRQRQLAVEAVVNAAERLPQQ